MQEAAGPGEGWGWDRLSLLALLYPRHAVLMNCYPRWCRLFSGAAVLESAML